MLPPRELRLRGRIDQLLRQRDQALAQRDHYERLWREAAANRDRYRGQRDCARYRCAMWKLRAQWLGRKLKRPVPRLYPLKLDP